MEKECCQVKCVETDEGFRIEISGKDIKEKFSGSCMQVVIKCGDGKVECCPPEDKKS